MIPPNFSIDKGDAMAMKNAKTAANEEDKTTESVMLAI